MKVAVCVKLNRGELSPFDASALACALSLPDAEITLLAMAPASAAEQLASLTRLGNVRGMLLSDGAFAGSDTIATSRVLAAALRILAPALVLCGRQSTDGDTAQVPPMLAARLGYELIPYVTEFSIEEAGTRLGRRAVRLPAVMSVERIAPLPKPSIFSKEGEVCVLGCRQLGLTPAQTGGAGSPTRVVSSFSNKSGLRRCRFVGAEELPALIRAAMAAKREMPRAAESGEKLPEVYFVGDIRRTAEAIAERAIQLRGGMEELLGAVKRYDIRYLLLEATLRNRALAPMLAARLEAGLTADCTQLAVQGGELRMYRPALGGDVIACIACAGDPVMATVRAENSSGSAVFSVGMGALPSLGKIREAAKRYGAETACSRKVVDCGGLPYEYQVGLTGRSVAPNVYVAFGISGAVQHVCAIENAGTVIAVNPDKNAPIFSYADLGVLEEIENVAL